MSERDWMMGALAAQDAYQPTPVGGDPYYSVRDPAELAAARVRRPYRGLPAPGSSPLPQLALDAVEMMVPSEPWEFGLMAMGPAGRLAGKVGKMGALAAGVYGSGVDDAEAGKGAAVKAAAGKIGDLLNIGAGDMRVSTRFPTAVKATEDPLKQHLSIGAAEMRASPGYEHNVGLLGNYPGFARLKNMDHDAAVQAYLEQARGNMQYLYANSPQVMKERSPHWYEGAHEVSDALARRWGVPRQSVSGALASLSPQMDWFKNASLGERTGDILTGAAAGRIMTPEMRAFGDASAFLRPDPKRPGNAELYRAIQGKSLDQLDDPLEKALWIRLYDEAHHPRGYRAVTPEGEFAQFITNQDGSLSKVGWGALGEIQKAVRSLQSGGDINLISPVLGTKHKVRNFYNNIEVPNDARFGDITADTHQVAAAHMRPLSGSSEAVQHNLASGGAAGAVNANSSALTGVQGTYGLVADATRMMAMENDMLPRAAQSATWEPVRELFPAKFKTAKNAEAVDDIWRAYDRGEISVDQARDRIFEFAGGIGTPEWARPGPRATAARKGSTYR